MRVLLYSSVLYLSGIVAVLYARPALMFRRDGRWKEFGVQGVDTTYFPFWLFCIVWAVTSYGLIRLFFSDDRGRHRAVVSAAAESLTAKVATNAAPAANAAGAPVVTEEAKPGYYRLDNSLMKRKGVPRYIYVGEEKPFDLEE